MLVWVEVVVAVAVVVVVIVVIGGGGGGDGKGITRYKGINTKQIEAATYPEVLTRLFE